MTGDLARIRMALAHSEVRSWDDGMPTERGCSPTCTGCFALAEIARVEARLAAADQLAAAARKVADGEPYGFKGGVYVGKLTADVDALAEAVRGYLGPRS